MTEALDIHQDLVEKMSDYVMAGSFDAFVAHIALPHRLVTASDIVSIDDVETACARFFDLSQSLLDRGVTQYARIAGGSAFTAPGEITGRDRVYLLQDGKPLTRPFEGGMILHRLDGVWRVREVHQGVPYLGWPAPKSNGGSDG